MKHGRNCKNQLRKHNIKFKNLQEQAEGPNLKTYIEDLFESILGEGQSDKVKIDPVFRVVKYRKNEARPFPHVRPRLEL